MSETQQDPKTGRFLTGNSGGGRPKGARNKIGEQFLNDLHELWQREGAATLELARQKDPAGFIRVVAALLPQESQVEVNVTHHDARERLTRKLAGLDRPGETGEPHRVTH